MIITSRGLITVTKFEVQSELKGYELFKSIYFFLITYNKKRKRKQNM